MSHRDPFSSKELSVVVSELLVATSDSSDPLLDDSVQQILRLLRLRLGMDVVFVSEFVDGRRMFRFVDAAEGAPPVQAGASNPVEESVCQRIVDGRLPGLIKDVSALPAEKLPDMPFRVGAHLSTPITMQDGHTYGTLCCFSTAPNPHLREEDLKNLRMCASLVAKKLQLAQSQGIKEPPPGWQLEPRQEDVYSSKVWATPMRSSR